VNISVVAEQTDYNENPAQNKEERGDEGGDAPVHPDVLPVAEVLDAIPFLALPRPFVTFYAQNYGHGQTGERDRQQADKPGKRHPDPVAYAPDPVEKKTAPAPLLYFLRDFSLQPALARGIFSHRLRFDLGRILAHSRSFLSP